MLRVIFDTNVYGLLLEERDATDLQRRITEDKEFKIYGFPPIRKEIRNIPTDNKLSKRTRNLLLVLYDKITAGHFLENSIKITNLAKNITTITET